LNKTFFFSFFFLLLIVSSVSAENPFYRNGASAELYVTAPFKETYKFNEDVVFRSYVFDSVGDSLVGVDASCSLKVYNSSNALTLDSALSSSGDAYLLVLNNSVLSSFGQYDYVVACNSSNESGFVNSFFDVNWDGESKSDNPILMGFLILLPMLFGFLLLWWAISLESDEHNGFKIILSLLSTIGIFVSLHFALVGIIKFYYFPELQGLIGSTVYWMTWVFIVFIFYWFIYFIIISVESARKKKMQKLEY
jgi:hypothetical protein